MSWRDDLQPASFRGVEFGVTRASDALGRRVVVHEFPQRDLPFAEDTGLKPRTVGVTGFVLGQDFMARRDRLEEALNQAGPGLLVHPWYGELNVSCTSAQVEHTADDGGMAVFTMAFVVVEAANAPTVSADARLVTRSRARLAAGAASTLLQQGLKLAGYADYVLTNTRSALMQGLDALGGQLGLDLTSMASWAQDVAGDAMALYDMVADGRFAQAFADLMGTAATASGASPGRLLDVAAGVPRPAVPEAAGVSTLAARRNAAALADAEHGLLVSSALDAAVGYVPPTREDARKLRADIVDAVDAVIERTPDSPDGTAQVDAFVALRGSALQAVAANAGRAPELVSVRPRAVLPSLVLAWRTAVDPTRALPEMAADAARRNQVPHPGFMPAGRGLDLLREVERAG